MTVEGDEQVVCVAHLGRGLGALIVAHGAVGLGELGGLVGRPAHLAVVPVLVGRAALGAGPLHEAVGEEHLVHRTVELRHGTRGDVPALVHGGEDGLGVLAVLGECVEWKMS